MGVLTFLKVPDAEAWISSIANQLACSQEGQHLRYLSFWGEADDFQDDFTGIWIIHDTTQKPDVVIYYAHGMITC